MEEVQEKLLSFEETMARLALSRAELYRKVKDDAVKAEKVDHRLQLKESEVQKFEEERDKTKSDLRNALETWLGFYRDRLTRHEGVDLPDLEGKTEDDLVGELGRRLVLDGILSGVSDIYLDPLYAGCRLLYRSEDGLVEAGRLEANVFGTLRDKLKVLAALKPVEGQQVIEGIFGHAYGDHTYQIQMTAAPTLLGEHLHLHFFRERAGLTLQMLGYSAAQAEGLNHLLTGRPGLFLMMGVADPAAEYHRLGIAGTLTDNGRLVVSLEHRIHYRSELLVQLKIEGPEQFDALLRTALEMAPDVLMLDEVRTAAEAQALLEAAQAGAFVAVQVRSPGCVEGLQLIIGHGLSRNVLARTLLGMSERIALRRLCPQCRASRAATRDEAKLLDAPSAEVWDAQGCDACGDGYAGRMALYGVWPVDEESAEAIRQPDTSIARLNQLCDQSDLSVRAAAREAVLAGEVSLQDARMLLMRAVSEG